MANSKEDATICPPHSHAQMIFADPKNDIAFKKIFGDQNNSHILVSFINAILGFEGSDRVVSVTITSPYQAPKIEDLKETILDVKAINERGEHFIVEMQKKNEHNFAKRSLYYCSKSYSEQLGIGHKYHELQKVYFIGFLNFDMMEGDHYVSRHLILNQETGNQDIADFEFSFIELNKFKKDLDELDDLLDKWIYFVKNAQNLDMIPQAFANDSEIVDAFGQANQHSWTKKEREIYDYVGINENAAQLEIEIAVKKGEARGEAKGKSEGKAEALISFYREGLISKADTILKLKDLKDELALDFYNRCLDELNVVKK
jgi:predicted transposase/invertase (TIGR01784 family)